MRRSRQPRSRRRRGRVRLFDLPWFDLYWFGSHLHFPYPVVSLATRFCESVGFHMLFVLLRSVRLHSWCSSSSGLLLLLIHSLSQAGCPVVLRCYLVGHDLVSSFAHGSATLCRIGINCFRSSFGYALVYTSTLVLPCLDIGRGASRVDKT